MEVLDCFYLYSEIIRILLGKKVKKIKSWAIKCN